MAESRASRGGQLTERTIIGSQRKDDMRDIGPKEAKIRARTRVGLMGLRDGERDPQQSPWRVKPCDCPCERCRVADCDECLVDGYGTT